MPRRYAHCHYPSTYQPLGDHLATRPEAEVVLTLAEIEALLGRSLPLSARVSPNWWTQPGYAQVRTWRTRGWRAHLDLRNACVRYTRDGDSRPESSQ